MIRTCANCGLSLPRVFLTVCEHVLCLDCGALAYRRRTAPVCRCADVDTSGPLAPVVVARGREAAAMKKRAA